ncbi:MAG: ATP-binding cassette domain-containing protein [Deltaproteobacteria bacterium]|nr:ATP-binding cassette domain-containing protein [Deltaproteobacteria bacterium]MBW2658067.1 ATP-binding cassette domain-containing protein [Deltaproteobacteria bacterium]
MDIKNFKHEKLLISRFSTEPGEFWCIYGENHSGIDSFVALFSGDLKNYTASRLHIPEDPGLLSFKLQQDIFEEELRNDNTDFIDRIDPGTPAKNFLPHYKNHLSLIHALGMTDYLDLGYRQLSSGQCRKLLLLKKILEGSTHIILQNPYDGLDEKSCKELDHALKHLIRSGIELLLIVSSVIDIPHWCTHLAIISEGRMIHQDLMVQALPLCTGLQAAKMDSRWSDDIKQTQRVNSSRNKPLIILRNGFAGYGGKKLFHGLDLIISPGDHTLITGPNGCGKSTLLDIITGDNPKCYANELIIFGKKRGTGESIWDIKKHMGLVSPSLHRDHRVPGSALQIVLSGFFDSIGLYQKASDQQIRTARRWIYRIGLQGEESRSFRELSHADQRLILIARAVIKLPRLLILDEPTQGLDDLNKNRLLSLLESIAGLNISTIIFVSHRKDEYRPFFRQHIELSNYSLAPR